MSKPYKLIVLTGIPASGKSTWARERVHITPNMLRVNKDDLRDMLHDGVWSKSNERAVIETRDAIINAGLKNRQTVIVDDTNFHPGHMETFKEIARWHTVELEVVDFPISLEEAMKRNATRAKPVPPKVIQDMYTKYVEPHLPKFIMDPTKPGAIVVDLDGTLAIHNDRSPFEFHKCYSDDVNLPVLRCVKAMIQRYNSQLIIVSGREDSCKEFTRKWLADKCGIAGNYELYMRKAGDGRKDSIVKEEIYRLHIIPDYSVDFVLDDRNQVVDHLRSLGLTVFQVAPGNF